MYQIHKGSEKRALCLLTFEIESSVNQENNQLVSCNKLMTFSSNYDFFQKINISKKKRI